MRRFFVVGHTQRAEAPIPLNDPAGAGRWDVLARAVTAALLVSNGIRRDSEAWLVLRAPSRPRTIVVRGAEVRNLNVDERAVLGLLSKALATPSVGLHPAPVAPGIQVADWDLAEALRRAGGTTVLLHEAGEPAASGLASIDDPTFVLSDHQEFSADDLASLAVAGPRKVRVGPVSLHTSSCIAVVHNLLDVAYAAPDVHNG